MEQNLTWILNIWLKYSNKFQRHSVCVSSTEAAGNERCVHLCKWERFHGGDFENLENDATPSELSSKPKLSQYVKKP